MESTNRKLPMAACRRPALVRRAPRPAFCALRPAFTLIELLVAVTIMGILASITLFALSGALESAKGDKTRATINKLNSLVMAKYESYRTRRVPITIPTGTSTQLAAQYRVDAIRDLMRMEMPDRYSDIQDNPTTHSIAGVSTSSLIAVPSATQAYRAALPAAPNFHAEAAKCLYLFISHGLDDPDVMSQFSEDEIARDSLDGMRYFVDGWGQPIYFIRWAPGFSSPLQPWNVNPTDALGNPTAKATFITSHDPFDPLKVYVPTTASDPFYNPGLPANAQFYPALYPLIISGGPDKITDIYFNGIPNGGGTEFQYSKTSPPNNPYVVVNNGLFGAPTDLSSIFTPAGLSQGDGVDNSIDNITNHDLSDTQ